MSERVNEMITQGPGVFRVSFQPTPFPLKAPVTVRQKVCVILKPSSPSISSLFVSLVFALHPHCRAHHVSITIHNSSPAQDDVPDCTNIGVSRWTGVHYCCFFTTSSFSSSRTTLGAYFSSDRFPEPFCLLLLWMSQNSARARTLQTGAVVTRG